MASTPNLIDIEAAMIAACTITAGVGGYNYTVPLANISQAQREITAIRRDMMPAVDIVYQGETSMDQPGMQRVVASYLISGYVAVDQTADEAAATRARRAASARMQDDLRTALYASVALHGSASTSGIATSFTLREYVDTTGVTAEKDSRGHQATCRLLADVVYFRRPGLTPPLT